MDNFEEMHGGVYQPSVEQARLAEAVELASRLSERLREAEVIVRQAAEAGDATARDYLARWPKR